MDTSSNIRAISSGKKGLQNEAMEKYALARETTNNGIVHLELDKFLQDKKTQVISQCRKLLEARHKSEASVYMELGKNYCRRIQK